MRGESGFNPVTSREQHCAERNEAAYELLLRAYEHSLDAQRDPWQFAIGASELKLLGLHEIDLVWLLNKGLAEQAIETTVPGDMDRCFRRLTTRIIGTQAFFILTGAGFEVLTHRQAPNGAGATQPDSPQAWETPASSAPAESAAPHFSRDSAVIPSWDPSQRELRFRGELVKRYRVPAPNQERILSAFQEEGWPHGIDDPLPPEADQDPIRRLQATVKSLNRNQSAALVRFRGNGNGDRVCWDVA
jgi:hypothetical protein